VLEGSNAGARVESTECVYGGTAGETPGLERELILWGDEVRFVVVDAPERGCSADVFKVVTDVDGDEVVEEGEPVAETDVDFKDERRCGSPGGGRCVCSDCDRGVCV